MDTKEALQRLRMLHLVAEDPEDKVAILMAIQALKQPERKKGKWEQQTEPLGAYEVEYAVCSVCNECYDLAEDYSIEDIRKLFAYCPNCGAKMEEEKNKWNIPSAYPPHSILWEKKAYDSSHPFADDVLMEAEQ